jgi:glycosyltransferase involved in cell wall biosynthesis
VRVITRLNIGGPAIHTLLLTREMAALEYRTMLVAGSCEPEDGDMRYLLETADPVYWVPELSRSVRPWRNLKALWRLWRLLRRERPAIVHTHTAMAGCLGRLAAVLSGAPIVIHTFHGNSLNEYFSRIQAGVFRRIEQLLARFTDALCVVSPQQARELSAKFHVAPAHKFHVVPLGLELDDYFALRPPAGTGPLTVGWFGRMVPVKNIALLAATIESALARCPDIRFVIAGDGPDRSALTGLLDRYGGRVEWLGWQREILPAVARCDVLLQTSRNEGTPVALIQGMAAARPFVSTAVGGVVDMVSSSAERAAGGARWYANGVLTESHAGTLADVLEALAGNRTLVSRMGLAGRAFASRQYRKETLVGNVDALYRELLNKKGLGRNS